MKLEEGRKQCRAKVKAICVYLLRQAGMAVALRALDVEPPSFDDAGTTDRGSASAGSKRP